MIDEWYNSLVKPPFTPPNAVFGPVWTVLYIMIGISFVMLLITKEKYQPKLTILLFAVHIILNLIWTPLFFTFHQIGLAFIDIILIVITLWYLCILLWKSNTISSILLWPYCIWVSFAAVLNGAFLYMNGW